MARRASAMGEEKTKIRWQTYVVAACWAVFGIGMIWVVPPFRDMFEEMWEDMAPVALPLWTRVVVGIPSAAWIAFGVLAGGALIWKSKLVSAKTAGLVDLVAVAAWFLAGMGVVIALFLPLIVTMSADVPGNRGIDVSPLATSPCAPRRAQGGRAAALQAGRSLSQ